MWCTSCLYRFYHYKVCNVLPIIICSFIYCYPKIMNPIENLQQSWCSGYFVFEKIRILKVLMSHWSKDLKESVGPFQEYEIIWRNPPKVLIYDFSKNSKESLRPFQVSEVIWKSLKSSLSFVFEVIWKTRIHSLYLGLGLILKNLGHSLRFFLSETPCVLFLK